METLLVTHSACLAHEVPAGHPERPDRLRAVLAALDAEEFALLMRETAPLATIEQIARVHDAALIDHLIAVSPHAGFHRIDADTAMSPGTMEAAFRAAGAVIHAVDEVMSGRARNAFCAIRPPGHHAEPDQAMGFCFFNNVAIGALHARAVHGIKRPAVIDFDVHHGNGTQAAFEKDASLFYASTHQYPLYPGTGTPDEVGVANNIVNACLESGAGSAEFRLTFAELILPALAQFDPDFIFISAGFDAHAADPLANLRLTEDDYSWATAELVRYAEKHCSGRVVSTLEGGYDLAALNSTTKAHVRALQCTL
ncbi:MAG: histone deacetylase family protein [Parvibaculum sp.]|nr:histone deacetylase family protein [Parvibaculum sp.]